jgi:hypothetical protein
MDESIYKKATRDKLRFPSSVGELTIEDLWELPLTTTKAGRPDLDTVARTVNADLKSVTEESFVDTKPNPRRAVLTLQLDIVKDVIATKIAERDAAKSAAEKAARKEKLLEALAAKEDQKLAGMSKEDIERELASL